MQRETVLYIHALAKMAFDASLKGDHPIHPIDFMDFFSELTRDRQMSSEDAWDSFSRSFDMEKNRRHERRHRYHLT